MCILSLHARCGCSSARRRKRRNASRASSSRRRSLRRGRRCRAGRRAPRPARESHRASAAAPADVGAPSPSRSSRPSLPTTSPVTFSVRGVSSARTSCTRPRSSSDSVAPRARSARRASQLRSRDLLDPTAEPGRRRDRAAAPSRSCAAARTTRSPPPLPTGTRTSSPRATPAASRPKHARPRQAGGPVRIAATRGSPARDTLELEIVDVPAAAAFDCPSAGGRVCPAEVDLRHRLSCPMFERSSSGIAATAITSTTTR